MQCSYLIFKKKPLLAWHRTVKPKKKKEKGFGRLSVDWRSLFVGDE